MQEKNKATPNFLVPIPALLCLTLSNKLASLDGHSSDQKPKLSLLVRWGATDQRWRDLECLPNSSIPSIDMLPLPPLCALSPVKCTHLLSIFFHGPSLLTQCEFLYCVSLFSSLCPTTIVFNRAVLKICVCMFSFPFLLLIFNEKRNGLYTCFFTFYWRIWIHHRWLRFSHRGDLWQKLVFKQ